MIQQNILELYQMIDTITDFFHDITHQTLTVGGCVGTQLLKYVLDCTTAYCPFKKVLVIDGCNDHVLSTLNKPIVNYLYYLDLFAETFVDGLIPYDPFKPAIMNPKPEYHKFVDTTLLQYYECVIINNAHLIPKEYRTKIVNEFHGKIVQIVDPYDLDGELFVGIPMITDTLQKQSSMVALARHLYGIDTRAIDKRIKGSFVQKKLNKRTIGKMDENQYVTDDIDFAYMIRNKQYQVPMRKRHKLIVSSNHLFVYPDQIGGRRNIGKNALLVAGSMVPRPKAQFRIYASKLTIFADVSYDADVPAHIMHVTPANILTVEEARHHRYNHTVFVQTKQDYMTRRCYYTLLKNSINMTACQM